MRFGEKLEELRTSKGMSQKALADAAGVTQAAISRWASGRQIPDVRDFQNLCRALGTRCTVFDGCDFSENEEKRGRGRPAKAPAAATTAGPNSARKPPRKKSKD